MKLIRLIVGDQCASLGAKRASATSELGRNISFDLEMSASAVIAWLGTDSDCIAEFLVDYNVVCPSNRELSE